MAESPTFLEGIGKVEKGSGKYRIALFCSEENPAICHRRLLIGRVLAERGTAVLHIRGDGRLQTEAELQAEEEAERNADGQQALFETDEVAEWKSIRSVEKRCYKLVAAILALPR